MTSGTYTTTCPGYVPDTEALSGGATWSPGVSSDLVGATAIVDCPMMADVTGATASGLPGQPCTGTDSSGETYTLTVSGYTFVLSPDGRTATENCSMQLAIVGGGASVVCSITETGSYQKISN